MMWIVGDAVVENRSAKRTRSRGLTVSLLALASTCLTAPAFAQEAAGPGSVVDDAIVVTATKLGTVLERAPVAASEIDAQTLELNRIDGVQDVQIRVPSLVYNSTSNFAQAFIRGIGNNFSLAGTESPVATYVDGVYLQRQAGAVVDVFDLQSITVLKGPQSTLYGRNATAGAILIQTADPTDRLEGRVAGEYGRFGIAKAEAVLNLPLSETLSVRIAGQLATRNAWIRDLATGGKTGDLDSELIRAKVAWRPSQEFSAIYTFEYFNRRAHSFVPHQKLSAPDCLPCSISGQGPSGGFYSTTRTPSARSEVEYTAQTLRLRYDGEAIELNSVTGLRDQRSRNDDDQEHMPVALLQADTTEKGPTFTQDFYARSRLGGPLDFLAGVSYERERATLLPNVTGIGAGPGFASRQKASIDSMSVYGDLYVRMTPELQLTVGARYNIDDKQLAVDNDPNATAAFGADTFVLKESFEDFTPHAILSYDSRNGYYYASFSRGAKSGNFPSPSFTPVPPVKSEKLDSYEFGMKHEWLNGTLKTNFAIFYGDYSKIQVQRVDATLGTVVTQNAAAARIFGIELDARWSIAPNFNIAAGATYLDNEFKNYPDAAVFDVNPAGPGLIAVQEDLSGHRLPRSPKYSVFGAVDYSHDFNGGWSAGLSLVARHTSSFDFLAGAGGPLRLDRENGYTKVDGTISVTDPSERTTVSLYMENILGEKYADFAASSTFGAYYLPAFPRLVGIRLSHAF